MLELLTTLSEKVAFKAPREMSGPNVYRLSQEVQSSFDSEQLCVEIDFSEVEYIDLHGIVLLRDLCELVSTCGNRTYAASVQPGMRELLSEVGLLDPQETEKEGQYELKSA